MTFGKKSNSQCLAQETIRISAVEKNEDKIHQLCLNYDILASEGHYHQSCYREYTKPKASPASYKISTEEENENFCSEGEEIVFQKWFQYIRSDIIKYGKVVTVALLTKALDTLFYENNLNPDSYTNKSFRRKSNRRLEIEFDGVAEIFLSSKGKLIFLPISKSRHSLATEIVELLQTLEKYSGISNKSKKRSRACGSLQKIKAWNFQTACHSK